MSMQICLITSYSSWIRTLLNHLSLNKCGVTWKPIRNKMMIMQHLHCSLAQNDQQVGLLRQLLPEQRMLPPGQAPVRQV
ncbi:hypothetical protein D3C74_369250 [compost metagenome]